MQCITVTHIFRQLVRLPNECLELVAEWGEKSISINLYCRPEFMAKFVTRQKSVHYLNCLTPPLLPCFTPPPLRHSVDLFSPVEFQSLNIVRLTD